MSGALVWRRIRAYVLVFVGLFVGALVLGLPPTPVYTDATAARVEARVRADDVIAKEDPTGLPGTDHISYWARGEEPFGSSYLERRSPYVYRPAYPVVAGLLHMAGLPLEWAFLLLTAAAIGATGIAAMMIYEALTTDASRSFVVGIAAGTVPALLKLVDSPAFVDPAAAAISCLALVCALRKRPLAAAALLVAAIFVRETSVFFVFPIVLLAFEGAGLAAAVSTAVAAIVAVALPQLWFNASFQFDWGIQIRNGLLAHREWRAWVDLLPNGLSVFLPLASLRLLLAVRARDRLAMALAATIACFAGLGVMTIDAGRVVTPAAAVVVALAFSLIGLWPMLGLTATSLVGALLFMSGEGAVLPLVGGFLAATLLAMAIVARSQTRLGVLRPETSVADAS